MSINPALQEMSVDDFSKITYDNVKLQEIELDVGEGGKLVAKLPDRDEQDLTEDSLSDLCDYLDIPFRFASRLHQDGKSEVLAYLHKELSSAESEPLVYTTDGDGKILSFTTNEYLPFRGLEGVELDQRILSLADADDFPLELKMRSTENYNIHYLFVQKEEHKVKRDPGDGTEPLWKWGYTFNYSLKGSETPTFGTSLLRMVCANLTYLPQQDFNSDFEWEDPTFEAKATLLDNFFGAERPEADWKQLNRWIKKMLEVPASMREVKLARSQILSALQTEEEDADLEERVDTMLHWSKIIKAYGLDDPDFRPSAGWYARASTPINLFDLYCLLTKEGTHASTDIPFEQRQGLLVYGGKMLSSKPDLQEIPPMIAWESVNG